MITAIQPKYQLSYDYAEIQIYHAQKGEGLPSHTHDFSHLTICSAGACMIRKKDKQLVITKNSRPVNLLADGWHEIEALEDETIFINIFSQNKF